MTLGEYLISARAERGVSQRELAEKCGISSAEISRVESGKRQKPSPTILKAVANALVISYPYLMSLAGYSQETHEEEQTFEQVFRDEDGQIVDVVRGVRRCSRRTPPGPTSPTASPMSSATTTGRSSWTWPTSTWSAAAPKRQRTAGHEPAAFRGKPVCRRAQRPALHAGVRHPVIPR